MKTDLVTYLSGPIIIEVSRGFLKIVVALFLATLYIILTAYFVLLLLSKLMFTRLIPFFLRLAVVFSMISGIKTNFKTDYVIIHNNLNIVF